MQPDDVTFNKCAMIERCLRRIREEWVADPELRNFTHQDAMVLNIERACQTAIDLAMHLVSIRHLGMPQNSGDAFELLHQVGMIPADLSAALRAMTGFRNVAIHQYRELDLEIVKAIATTRYRDFILFCRHLGVTISDPV